MAIVRKARAYSKRNPVTNTRKSKKTQFSYVKQVPNQKIVKFNMGDPLGFEQGKYPIKVTLSTEENIQIRDLALESARQAIHKEMTTLFQKSYFLRCNCFPHNILRNNRVFSGGSKGERIQTGMSKSFGTPEGRAAVLRKGAPVFTAYFTGEDKIPQVRHVFKSASPKLPCKTKMVFEILRK